MTTPLFVEQTAALQERFASVTNIDPVALSRETVAITARPDPAPWPFTMMIVSFGLGAVVCVEQKYLEWARSHVPSGRDDASYLGYALEREARVRGEALNAGPPILGWALSGHQAEGRIPDRLRLESVDSQWMKEWQSRGLFTNALGLPEQAHRTFRNQFACVAFDADGKPAAVAGAYDTGRSDRNRCGRRGRASRPWSRPSGGARPHWSHSPRAWHTVLRVRRDQHPLTAHRIVMWLLASVHHGARV
jgi:hypothetical protein